MKKLLFAVLGGLLLAGCQAYTPPTAGTPSAQPTPTPTPMVTAAPTMVTGPKTVMLTASNNSGVTGTALFEEVGGKVKVTLTMMPKSSVAEPAHIHVGVCPVPGDVKWPLTSVVNGKSVTTLNVTMNDLFADGNLAVNVHKSAKEVSVYISCGDLK